MAEKDSEKKLSHEEVGYQRYSTHTHEECGNCSMFVPGLSGNNCTLVVNPIHAGGWCRRWEPMRRRKR